MKKQDLKKRIGICFGKNDIRCVYGKELDEEIAYRTGRAAALLLKAKRFVVGYDFRISSESLRQAFMRGLTESGADVIDIGMVDTPSVYFASGFLNLPAGMITASHNPAKYNGIKLTRARAEPIGEGTGLDKIKKLVERNKFPKKKKGKIVGKSLFMDYVNHVRSFVNVKNIKNIKVAVDAGNGMAGRFIPMTYKKLDVRIVPLDFKIAGKFMKHVANPAERKNIRDLISKVKKTKADFGIAFDGDMDRVFFVDEKGKVIDSSLTAALIIKHLLQKKKGKKIVYNLAMSKIIPETARKYGAKAIKSRVGHSFIKPLMKKNKATFGCENSAHYYYDKNYYADSGLITSLVVSEIYALAKKKGKKFSDLMKEFEKYAKSEEKNIRVADKAKLIKRVENRYKRKAKKIERIDGITFDFGDYWFNIRASNTEPFVRINLEAKNQKLMRAKLKELMSFVRG